MNRSSNHILKCTDNRHRYRAKAKSKRRINSETDLVDQLGCLQRAFAEERGQWTRFRNEVIAAVNSLLDLQREKGGY